MRRIPDSLTLLHRLKSRQILLLLALNDEGSIRKAANRLHVTQPTASKLLQDLEDTLGLRLFERNRRGIEPNDFGVIMVNHARLILSDLDHACLDLTALASGATGQVRIGCILSAVPFPMARAIARLKAKLPGLSVSVDVSTSNLLIPELLQGDLDVLIARPLSLLGQTDLDYEALLDEPLVITCGTDHPLVSREDLTLADLADWSWVLLPTSSPMRKVLAPILAEISGRQTLNVVETSSMMLMAALLQESDMLAVMPQAIARYHSERGLLCQVKLTLPPVMGAYGIVTRRNRPLFSGVAAFLRELRAVLDEDQS